MENQDLDLIGKTVGNMPYKIGIVDKDGKLKNQFVVNASTNRIDIPEQMLSGSGSTGGSTGGNTGGTTGGNTGGGVSQLPSTVNLFTGSAVGNILLSGPTANYDNVQDGLLITLGNTTLETSINSIIYHCDLSSIGLQPIKIPKEKLVVNSSFDISDQLSQYVGKNVQDQYHDSSNNSWSNVGKESIASFGGTTINVLPNTTLSMTLTMKVKVSDGSVTFQIPVIRVNTYKN